MNKFSTLVSKIMSVLFRPRYLLFVFLLVVVPMLDTVSDPDTGIINNLTIGASFINYLVLLGRATLAVLALHWLISFIFDSDLLDLVKMAREHPENNGIYMIALGLFVIGFAIVISSVLSIGA